jgi:hypothetical protein
MQNKKTNIAYWSLLILMTIGMLFSAIPSVLKLPYSVEYFCGVLKLPEYLLVFTGVLKLLGLIVLYLPGLPRLKEWTFAGFAFDLLGAWYCSFMALSSFTATIPILIYLVVLFALYYLHHKRAASKV